MRRMLGWFSALNVAQKVSAVLFGGVLLFSVAYLITSGVLLLLFATPEGSSSVGEDRRTEEASVSDERVAAPPGMDLRITRAEWVGNTVEVDGGWGGEISSVHCDLFEGRKEQRITDWWDRSVPPSMSWSEHTFTQVFTEAEQNTVEDPVDPSARYIVTCVGSFANGWSTNASAVVVGKPSA